MDMDSKILTKYWQTVLTSKLKAQGVFYCLVTQKFPG